MTNVAEFEEKTYEKYFGHELSRLCNFHYSPGQQGEHYLGFDEAFMIPWWVYAVNYRHLMPRRWAFRHGISLTLLEELSMELSGRLPGFKCNFFVQFKRPEFVSGHGAAEWSSWGRPYYRYHITPHQQSALSEVKTRSGDRAEVVYASPAFWKQDRLFYLAKTHRIIEQSNIAPITLREDHKLYTYVSPGNKGIAHSEPEAVIGPTLEEIISSANIQEAIPFRDHVIKTASVIEKSLAGDEDGLRRMDAARHAFFYQIEFDFRDIPAEGFVYDLSTISAFSDVFNVRLFMIG